MTPRLCERRGYDALLAWYFVTVWGSGFLASKIGLQHAAPFTFLSLRFAFGLACLVPIVLVTRPKWPATPAELRHVIVAGLLEVFGGAIYIVAASQGRDSVAVAAVLSSQFAAIAAVGGYFLFGERLQRLHLLGVVAIAIGTTALAAIEA